MTANLICHVGVTDSALSVPPLDYIEGVDLGSWLSQSSVDIDGGQGFTLEVQRERQYYAVTRMPTTALYLQMSLQRLLNSSPSQTARKVNKIGLIYSRYYYAGRTPKPGVFGLMFDLGFQVSGFGRQHRDHLSVPRQGCAVFLDAIAQYRSPGDDQNFEAVFTSIHELGHVFNLWHTQNELTFMSSSKASSPYGYDACRFSYDQKEYLHSCHLQHPYSHYVHPGASRFGERGPLGRNSNVGSLNRVDSSPPIRIRIGVQRDEVFYFEPVELDVEVSLNANELTELNIPDTIDPGYENFILWITEPEGVRRKFRSPRRYCSNVETLTLRQNIPFKRDISVHGESGGFTFTRNGEYLLQIELHFDDGGSIKSNELSILVRDADQQSRQECSLRELLHSSGIAHLLYHRQGRVTRKRIEALQHTSKLAKPVSASLAADIDLSTMMFVESGTRCFSSATRKRWHGLLDTNFSQSDDNRSLVGHRRSKLEQLQKSFNINI